MNLIQEYINRTDKQWLKEHVVNLYKLERKQSFSAYKKAAEYTYNLLKAEGFEAELLPFPADGKTVYQDKTCPIGWDVTDMRLELLTSVPGIADPVLSDYKREPLSCAKHSTSTPPEGICTNIVTENQMKAGENVEGAFVLLNPTTRPGSFSLRMLLDLGAIGWISDFQEEGLNEDIDAVYWCNAATENITWAPIAIDRDYISYQVSPRVASRLRAACDSGTVMVRAYSDGRRYETEQYAVTSLLPGEDKREIWILSHLYEPLIDDNSNGVIGTISMMKILRDLVSEGKIHLKYSIRFVAASEMYGMSAVAEHFGGDLSARCIGAINTDGTTGATDKSVYRELNPTEAPDQPGFVGNLFMKEVCRKIAEATPDMTLHYQDHRFADDCFLADSTTGLPTVWFRHTHKGNHHHSTQDESAMDVTALAEHLAYHTEWVRLMAGITEEEIRALLPLALKDANEALCKAATQKVRKGTNLAERLDFIKVREQEKIRGLKLYTDIEEIEKTCASLTMPTAQNETEALPCTWFDYSENFVFSRIERGFPHDMAKAPKEERRYLPGGVTYTDFGDVLSRMDGKKTFKRVLTEIEWDMGLLYEDSTVKEYLQICILLAKHGYLGMQAQNAVTRDALKDALRRLGVAEGETLLVHTSLSGLGYVEDGAEACIDAVQDVLGENGTFLVPAFTRPYISCDGVPAKTYGYRPYDTRPNGALRDKNIWTGAVPNAMLQKKNVFRSGHVSHEWVAMGKNAEEMVAGHGFLEAPCGETSPMKKALDADGSVVFIGCSVGANTFIHYIETAADVPFLTQNTVKYIDSNGITRQACIEKHVGGCRSFYRGLDHHFYKEAIRRGLQIYEAPLGIGKVYRIKLRELYEIGMQMHKDDPFSMLCGDDGCPFCRTQAKKK